MQFLQNHPLWPLNVAIFYFGLLGFSYNVIKIYTHYKSQKAKKRPQNPLSAFEDLPDE